MINNNKTAISTQLSDIIVYGIQEKKGNEIVRLDLRNIAGSVTDYFVICHADSSAQIQAIAKSVEEEVYKSTRQEPWRREGLIQGEWVLLDFVDVVVHIFQTEMRRHYGIEHLWGDAEMEYYRSA